MGNKGITVSDTFLKIYKYFNVSDQKENMKLLSKRELYYLLVYCFDKHDEDDPIVLKNFSYYEKEITELLEFHETGKTDIIEIKDLDLEIKKLFTKKLCTDNIVTESGEKMPNVFTKVEVRELKLDNILDK